MPLQVAAHGHIELLVGAAELEVGLDRHRVVALQQGIKELVQGDGRARAVAVGEVFLGQHLAHGGNPEQFDRLGQVQARQPLAVAAHLQPTRGLEIEQGELLGLALAQLGQVGAGVGRHRLGRELDAGSALAGGIADAGGEIANDQHRRMAGVLEGPQLAEQDRVAQVDVGAGGIDAELHPQGTALAFSVGQEAGQALARAGFGSTRSQLGPGRRKQVGHAPLQPGRQSPRLVHHQGTRPALRGGS